MVDSRDEYIVFENSSADEKEEIFSGYRKWARVFSKELEAMKFDCSEDIDSSEENESDTSRLKNLHCCTCEEMSHNS